MASKKMGKRTEITIGVIVLFVVLFPFLLSVLKHILVPVLLRSLNIDYPNLGDLLAYYGTVIGIGATYCVYYLTKRDKEREKKADYLREKAPGMSIELEGTDADEDYAYSITIINRKEINFTIEKINNTHVNLTVTKDAPYRGTLQIGKGSRTKSSENIYIDWDNFELKDGLPSCLNMTVVDDDGNDWDCWYDLYRDGLKSRYRLSSADRTYKIKIEEECITK